MINNTDLAFGNKYEQVAMEYLKDEYGDVASSIELLEYETHKEEQWQGQDIKITFKDGRTITYQIKSRKGSWTDLAFEVYKDGERWRLKLPKATHYAFFIPKLNGDKPYIFPVDYVAVMFEKNYESWIKSLRPNGEGDGYCIYVSIEDLKDKMNKFVNLCIINCKPQIHIIRRSKDAYSKARKVC